MDDDDRLDPVLVDRFRALDEVIPPDTWAGGAATRTAPARWWPVAAAAVVVLIVGVAVVLRGDDEGVIVGAPVTSPSTVSATVAPNATPAPASTVYVVEDAMAVAEPAVAPPGAVVTITPSGTVQRYCDKVNVIGPEVGSILGGVWRPGEEEVPATFSCDGPVSNDAVDVTIPFLSSGDYRFCIALLDVAEGCALVTVVGPDIDPIEPAGIATPSSAFPGERVSIAPSVSVRRTCADLVTVYGGATYLGHVGGARFSPSPGDGDSVPACEGDVSADPIETFVPDLPAGTYVFCVSADLIPEGCARIVVLASPLLATVSSSEVSTGDEITVTPAGVIDRICTGWVRVFDAALTTPVRELIDPASGASEEPAFGGWEAPDCEPVASDDAVTLVVPDLLLGAYAFCLSAEPQGASCALVYVTAQRFVEPTVPPGPTEPPVTTAPPTGPVVVTEGRFLGVQSGSFAAAADAVRANTVEIADSERPVWACSLGLDRVWLTRLGGLEIVWEGSQLETAFPANWRYVGASVVDGQPMVTDRGITVGSTRAEVLAAYPGAIDDGDVIFVDGFRIGLDGTDNVTWLGNVQCGD